MDQLQTMKVFVAVSEEQGFAPAARRLGMSPPAVTRAVAALEKRLEPLMAGTSPWRFSARELAGLLAKRSGDTAKAKKLFSGLADDRRGPQGIRNRAREMLSILGK